MTTSDPKVEKIRAQHAMLLAVGFPDENTGYLLTKLDEAETGLFDTYVALGFDTDGARTAREFFSPIVGEEPVEVVVKAAREFRADVEREADAAEERERTLIAGVREALAWEEWRYARTYGDMGFPYNSGAKAATASIHAILSRLLPSSEEGKK